MIEENLKRLADAAERIALALERGVPNATTPLPTAPPAAAPPAATGKKKPAAEPVKSVEPVAPAKSFLDDDADEPATPMTKEDVKKALVAAQERLAKKLGDAKLGMTAAMKILTDNSGGAETLKALPDDQAVFIKVVNAANAAGV